MYKNANDRQQVSFGVGSNDGIFSFYLNEELNEGLSTFYANSDVYIDCFNSGLSEDVFTTAGNIVLYKKDAYRDISTPVLFEDTDRVKLNYPIYDVGGFYWFGTSLGSIRIEGNTLVASNKGYGVLMIKYTTVYNIYKLKVPTNVPNEPSYIIVYGYNDLQNKASISISINQLPLSDKDIIIESKDYDLDIVIPEADVWVNGEYVGKTNNDGLLNLGKLPFGRYSVIIKKSGYKSTDTDALNNDYFVVG